jgi:ligand-binding SRPBCC domain-containing protein
MLSFKYRSLIPAPAETVFGWHMRPGALERLIPPWENIRVLERKGGISDGSLATIRLRKGLYRSRWVAVHKDIVPGRQFADEQLEGPFERWVHTHRMSGAGPDRSILEDEIRYELPLGRLGEAVAGGTVAKDLQRAFQFRHRRTREDLERHSAYTTQQALRIAISGASGLIGRNLTAFLSTGGHQTVQLVRREPRDPIREIG